MDQNQDLIETESGENPDQTEELNIGDDLFASGNVDDSKGGRSKLLQSMIDSLNDEAVVAEIEYVAKNFLMFTEFIKKVESEVLSTTQLLEMVDDLRMNLMEELESGDPKITKIWNHFEKVIDRNEGFKAIRDYFKS